MAGQVLGGPRPAAMGEIGGARAVDEAQLAQATRDEARIVKLAHPDRDIAVIIPELVQTRWYHVLVHNQTAAIIKAYLLFSGFRRVIVVNVPWYLND